ncbi:hypothetical protein [Thiobacillus sp.]
MADWRGSFFKEREGTHAMELSHWDLVESFTGWEAACLASGIDPKLSDESRPEQKAKAELIYRELMNAYNRAHSAATFLLTGKRDKDETIYSVFQSEHLPSTDLLREARVCLDLGIELRYENISGNDEEKLFSRGNLNDWFVVKNYRPAYAFLPSNDHPQQPAIREKPLTTKERTSLLTVIALLTEEARIDISKPSKAAATILKLAETQGINIAQRTIEEYLKKIPDALEKRGKS